ncbi:PD-(D/E)XK nuclease family protein [Algoriphagus sediminis]|uniref:PD-(D/E)XK nuclease family protein n=1 Tax=Algoriphagus sediminis TaxID=3057113 RepID=A0ABT7Y9T9_9BACT|nr:PD-(D/E)XK nuclease family protein [Algoriphagus sediminis]MDN3203274.1 PD-(D/E)XK nuclease family protein [Algoriphagus sediminis]
MSSFLKDTAQQLLASDIPLKEMMVVLPNRRAGLFFTKYLSEAIAEPQWMPEVKTIEEVFYDLKGERPADELTLIFELHRIYSSLQTYNSEEDREKDSFEKFYFWGEIILKDFNDIDQFLADPEKVYENLAEQKILESDLSFLTEEQRVLISQFWKSFEEQSPEEKQKFLRFWEILGSLYQKFQASLETLGLSYGGRIYRSVIENLNQNEKPEKHVYFLGFNAFTKAEEKLIKHYIKEFGARIFWDIDQYYLQDNRQEAGLFFRDYQKDPIFGPTFPEDIPDRISGKNDRIHTYSIPLKSNQANLVGKIAESIGKEEALEETVVILPDEQLLFPVLHALPNEIEKLNVTMGYPIRNAPVFAFLDAVLDLQRYLKEKEDKAFFYHKPVIDLLAFTYLRSENEGFVEQAIDQIRVNNQTSIPAESLAKGGKMFELIFRKVAAEELFVYLSDLIRYLASSLENDPVQRSYLFQAFKQLTRIQAIFRDNQRAEINKDFYLKIFRKLFRELKLPFDGEPLEGLQIMGVLESRNLDFKRVIICDLNEGSFPPGGGINSMIPFNLRRAFGLPVQEQNDAIYAYTFYRLLHRAEEVHLIYTTASDQGKVGEMSRFVQQMKVELGITSPSPVMIPVDLTKGKEIRIEKSEEVLKSLRRYYLGQEGGTSFSASALNTYLDCRLRFYLRYIAGLKEKEEVVSEIDPSTFGTLLHNALELLYAKKEGDEPKVITSHEIKRLKETIPNAVEKAIRDFYHLDAEEELELSGQLQIARAVISNYIKAVLDYDLRNGDFKILSLEKKYFDSLEVETFEGERKVALSGLIDRVDEKDGVIRLIDYKTGKDKKKVTSIESLFDRDDKNRNKAAMQTLLYSRFFKAENPGNPLKVKPAIFNVREIYNPDFNPFLMMEKAEIEDFSSVAEEFEVGLHALISEIFDKNQEFNQTEDEEKCEYCPYKEICGR